MTDAETIRWPAHPVPTAWLGLPLCHFCHGPIEVDRAIHSITGNALAHFSCWYDGTPVEGPDGKVF